MSEPSSGSRVFYRRVISSILTQGSGLLVGFVGSVILARYLGPEGRGVVSWIMALQVLGAAIAQVGMPQVNRRYALEHASRIHDLTYLTVFVCFGASMVLLPLLIIAAFFSPIVHDNLLPFAIAMLGMPLLAIADTLGNLQVGLGRSKAFNLAMFAQKITSVILIAGAAYLAVLSPLAAVIAIVIGICAKLGIAIRSLRGHWRYDRAGVSQLYREVRRYMGFSSIGQIAMLMSSHSIIVLLGLFSADEQVGYYAASYVLVEAMCTVPKMFGLYMMPRIVALPRGPERLAASRQTLLAVLGIMAVGSAIAAVLADWGIPFLFGKDFEAAVIPFYWLLLGSLAFSIFSVLYGILSAETDKRALTYPPLCSAVVLFICAFLLYAPYGALGGAISWMLANAVASIVSYVLLRRIRAQAE